MATIGVERSTRENPQVQSEVKIARGCCECGLKGVAVFVSAVSLVFATGAAACSLEKKSYQDLTCIDGLQNSLAVISVIGFLTTAALWKMGECFENIGMHRVWCEAPLD